MPLVSCQRLGWVVVEERFTDAIINLNNSTVLPRSVRQSTLLSLSHHLEIPTLFPSRYWVLYRFGTLLPVSLSRHHSSTTATREGCPFSLWISHNNSWPIRMRIFLAVALSLGFFVTAVYLLSPWSCSTTCTIVDLDHPNEDHTIWDIIYGSVIFATMINFRRVVLSMINYAPPTSASPMPDGSPA